MSLQYPAVLLVELSSMLSWSYCLSLEFSPYDDQPPDNVRLATWLTVAARLIAAVTDNDLLSNAFLILICVDCNNNGPDESVKQTTQSFPDCTSKGLSYCLLIVLGYIYRESSKQAL